MIAYAKGKDIWVMSASGEGQRELVKDTCEQIWSPDSKEFAFVSYQLVHPDVPGE